MKKTQQIYLHLALLLIFTSMMTLSACSSRGNQGISTLKSQQEPRGIIWKATQDQEKLHYRVDWNIQAGDNTVHQVELFEPPDKYKYSGDNGSSTLMIGENVYMFDPGQNTWILSTLKASDIKKSGWTEEGIQEARFLKEETINGKPAKVYAFKMVSQAGGKETVQQVTIWIGNKDDLPYKFVIEGETMSINDKGETQIVPTTSTGLVEYDPTVKVEAPK